MSKCVRKVLASNPFIISKSDETVAFNPGTGVASEIAAIMGRLNLNTAIARCLNVEKLDGVLVLTSVSSGDGERACMAGVVKPVRFGLDNLKREPSCLVF
jgi:hypothetical protein